MKTEKRIALFIGLTLLAGVISGSTYAGMNLLLVEPLIDQAIGIEIQNLIDAGEEVEMNEMASYRLWQKGGAFFAGAILGISFACLYAIVYSYSQRYLPGSSYVKKGLLLASIMWMVLFMVPFIKYPGNPPAVGDPETIYYRQALYIAFITISGFSALGLSLVYRKIPGAKSRILMIPAIYAGFMTALYFAFPPNPDPIPVPMDLVTSFRAVSTLTALGFWLVLGAVFGALWNRFSLYIGIRKTAQ